MPKYLVTWEIHIDADDPVSAAKEAEELMIDPERSAWVYDVFDEDGNMTHIDLAEMEEE